MIKSDGILHIEKGSFMFMLIKQDEFTSELSMKKLKKILPRGLTFFTMWLISFQTRATLKRLKFYLVLQGGDLLIMGVHNVFMTELDSICFYLLVSMEKRQLEGSSPLL